MQFRQVRGGALVQPPPSYVLDLGEVCWDAYPIDDPGRRTDLILAWAAVFSAAMGGNEVALVKDGQLIGIGGGPATVDAARAAAGMAASNRHDTAGCSFAADAFFPATDAPAELVAAGVSAGVAPGGGKMEQAVRKYFRNQRVTVGYLPPDIRGFCRH
jgi:phosphoribosylaminoimidazolecarboxamide formyltransferase/IMP cyclohydrolase